MISQITLGCVPETLSAMASKKVQIRSDLSKFLSDSAAPRLVCSSLNFHGAQQSDYYNLTFKNSFLFTVSGLSPQSNQDLS